MKSSNVYYSLRLCRIVGRPVYATLINSSRLSDVFEMFQSSIRSAKDGFPLSLCYFDTAAACRLEVHRVVVPKFGTEHSICLEASETFKA